MYYFKFQFRFHSCRTVVILFNPSPVRGIRVFSTFLKSISPKSEHYSASQVRAHYSIAVYHVNHNTSGIHPAFKNSEDLYYFKYFFQYFCSSLKHCLIQHHFELPPNRYFFKIKIVFALNQFQTVQCLYL